MDVLRDLVFQGKAEGVVVVADHQTAGRGREHRAGEVRPWESPAGKNLYLSAFVDARRAGDEAGRLPLAVGVAIAKTVGDYCPDHTVHIKWPNDVLVDDKKISGVLIQSVSGEKGFLVGIGLNVNAQLSDFSPQTASIATSLRLITGSAFDLHGEALEKLLGHLSLTITHLSEDKGWDEIHRYVSDRLHQKGRRVSVVDQNYQGIGHGISVVDGALLVQKDDGTIDRVGAGDVNLI